MFIHVYSCSSLLCTFCFCRVYVSGISSCPVHPVFFSLNKSVQFSSVQFSSVQVTASSSTSVLSSSLSSLKQTGLFKCSEHVNN